MRRTAALAIAAVLTGALLTACSPGRDDDCGAARRTAPQKTPSRTAR
ncbi:hypothetical protein [Streptomyces sp. NPDC004763]